MNEKCVLYINNKRYKHVSMSRIVLVIIMSRAQKQPVINESTYLICWCYLEFIWMQRHNLKK